ncbi:hypothetical protein, partial [Antarctobacter jejuensis]|uniref:hypothetical protein n=1 Tax=Antarctobacter jejuensis TaxID=1439938 RepID=UPI003FD1A08D
WERKGPGVPSARRSARRDRSCHRSVFEAVNHAVHAKSMHPDPRTRKECRCIVLIEHELRLFELVFGADWDRYILLTRFAGFPGELEAAIEEDRLPDALTDGETVTLAAMVTLILLHEVGHSADYSIDPTEATIVSGLNELIESLDEKRREELRADAFTGSVLERACFERRLDPGEENACLAASELSMLTFIVGMKGKSRDARCLRFLDTVPGYPNWQARFMTIGLMQHPGPSSIGLLRDYIETRNNLMLLPWLSDVPVCRSAIAN